MSNQIKPMAATPIDIGWSYLHILLLGSLEKGKKKKEEYVST